MMSDDMTFCPAECERESCYRNKCHIKEPQFPHSYYVEIPEGCPKSGKARENRSAEMTYEDIYKKACDVIGAENISDYRPAVFSAEPDTFLGGVEAFVPNTIMIWLKNNDLIWYRVGESEGI